MYTLAVRRDFIAQHALIGGEWGEENLCHSHHYVLELQLEGTELDQHGYIVDILDVELQLSEIVSRYRDHFLNDFPEFAQINPSLERFAQILCNSLSQSITAPNVNTMRVVLWENNIAWASYQVKR